MEGAINFVVPPSLSQRILLLSDHPPNARHSAYFQTYDTLARDFYWPRMAADIELTFSKFQTSVRNTPRYRRKRTLQILFTTEFLNFIAMNILEPFPKTMHGQHLVRIITDRYSKETRAISTLTKTSTSIAIRAILFFDHWIVPYDIPFHLLTANGTQIKSKFFTPTYPSLGARHPSTTAYRLQTNGQAECCNKIILTFLPQYVGKH